MIRFEDHVRALGPDKPSNPKPDTPTLADPRTLNFSKKKALRAVPGLLHGPGHAASSPW